jgi:hypothetical protein
MLVSQFHSFWGKDMATASALKHVVIRRGASEPGMMWKLRTRKERGET